VVTVSFERRPHASRPCQEERKARRLNASATPYHVERRHECGPRPWDSGDATALESFPYDEPWDEGITAASRDEAQDCPDAADLHEWRRRRQSGPTPGLIEQMSVDAAWLGGDEGLVAQRFGS